MALAAAQMHAAIQYSGTVVNQTFQATTGSRREMVDGVSACLAAAGWSYITGQGTADVVMQSATTAQGLAARIRLLDPGSGTSAKFTLQNANGTLAMGGSLLLIPSVGTTYRCVAGRHQAFVFKPNPQAGEYIAFGVPWIPDFLTDILTTVVWAGTNCADVATCALGTAAPSFRTTLSHCSTGSEGAHGVILLNTQWWANNSAGHTSGCLELAALEGVQITKHSGWQWWDGTYHMVDPLIIAGATGAQFDVGRVIGQLWDAVMISDGTLTLDSQVNVDNKVWYVAGCNASASLNDAPGCLLLVLP